MRFAAGFDRLPYSKMIVMRRVQLALMLLATLSLGVVAGGCRDHPTEIDMVLWCGDSDPSTCREICEVSGGSCESSDECSAYAYGLDFAQCDAGTVAGAEEEGVMLDVGCDDHLPEYYGYLCCCQRFTG
jgi:hypothetical protein